MSKNSSLERANRGRGEVVASKGTEVVAAADDEFAQRLADRKRNLFRTFFPSKAQKKIEEYETRMVGLAAEGRLENYRMYVELQRQVIKEALDDFLLQGKVRARDSQTEFFAIHQRDLQLRVNDITQQYFADMDDRFERLENSGHRVAIRQREERMLELRMDEFETTTNRLMTRFASIPEEGV